MCIIAKPVGYALLIFTACLSTSWHVAQAASPAGHHGAVANITFFKVSDNEIFQVCPKQDEGKCCAYNSAGECVAHCSNQACGADR